jgi:hypothetical protein
LFTPKVSPSTNRQKLWIVACDHIFSPRRFLPEIKASPHYNHSLYKTPKMEVFSHFFLVLYQTVEYIHSEIKKAQTLPVGVLLPWHL